MSAMRRAVTPTQPASGPFPAYDASWGRLWDRTRPAIGNHEYLTPGGSAYFSYFGNKAGEPGRGYYSYDLGTWHVVVLNATGQTVDGAVVPATFVASISGDGRSVVTKPVTQVQLQADRALELWAVPGQGAPRSLGLISAQGTTIVKRGKLLENTDALAVSLEPPGGSPTGAPTGPILWAGKLKT